MATTAEDATGKPTRVARAGLWLLPVYAMLLVLSTLTSQPDPKTEFADYSRYITTDIFLVSHLVGSVLGAGLGLVGLVAALLFLVRGPAATGAMVGVALTIVANTLFTAMFGAAAFAQPAIGRAFLAGVEDMQTFNDDVYGAPLLAVFGVGALLFIVGVVVFGWAVARTSQDLRWPGYCYAAGLAAFVVFGPLLSVLQPVAGVVALAAAIMIAVRLPRATIPPNELRPHRPTDL